MIEWNDSANTNVIERVPERCYALPTLTPTVAVCVRLTEHDYRWRGIVRPTARLVVEFATFRFGQVNAGHRADSGQIALKSGNTKSCS